jgi:glucose/arabinose dehydrogenase
MRDHLTNCVRTAPFAAMAFLIIGMLLGTGASSAAPERNADPARTEACADDNGGITLPPGFCATVFADNIGHARHLVLAPNRVVYVNTWSGRYYRNDTPPPGGFLVAPQDTTGDGRADVIMRFGETREQGSAGGTGIALYNGGLFAEVNDRIVRYALPEGAIVPTREPEVIVSGLPLTGDHPMHPFEIDAQGNLYVDLGSATNACQIQNRMPNSPGIQPCTELETRAGIWRYDANRTGQQFSPAERFVTGLRNGEGIAFDAASRLFATQHGRDQLRENWPNLYTSEQGANEPAEELVQLERGADYGWPYCYFDLAQQKLVLAPEYGGDGGKAIGPCAQKRGPVAVFPAHWAPNDLVIYDGQQFPAAYRGVRSSPSTGRGTAPRSPRAATTWCSSRSRTASLPGNTWSSPTASPARSKNRVGPRTGRRGSRSGRTARSTSRTTPTERSISKRWPSSRWGPIGIG